MTLKTTTDKYYLLFLFIVFLVLIAGLGSYGLAESSEARYAEISREMFLSGDYINPELLGIFHFHKPPIAYYITTFGYQIFGVNEFGARFFLQVALIIQLWLIYKIALLLFKNKTTAFIAGLVYFAMPIVLISTRNLTTDAFLTTFIIAAVYCWQVYTSKFKTSFLYLCYIMIGMALLTKGPVALLFIAVYIFIYKIIFKKGWKISIHHILGTLAALAIGFSWYILVVIENPILWDYFIKDQLISRMNSNSFNRGKPFWYYLPIVFGLLLPWLLALVPDLKQHIKSISQKQKETKTLLYSGLVLLIVFSIFKTKLISYILPMFWMIALFIASEIQKASQSARSIINIVYTSLLGLIFLGLVIMWFVKSNFIQISTTSIIIGLVMVIIFVVAYARIKKTTVLKTPLLAGIFGMATVLISTSVMATNSAAINSTRDMIQFIDANSNGEKKTIMVYDYLLTSIPFYTNDLHITLKSTNNTTKREVQFEKDKSYKKTLWDVQDEKMLAKIDSISNTPNTYLIARNRRGSGQNKIARRNNFQHKKEYPKWTIYYND